MVELPSAPAQQSFALSSPEVVGRLQIHPLIGLHHCDLICLQVFLEVIGILCV